jgi:Na+/melibiose symporter-like transporter
MSLVGFIMTIDNILAIFLIPIVSAWSDRTNTRIGRRMPYILVLLPLTAIFFGAIPYAAGASLAALIAILLLLNVTKQSVRGPVVALMPDTIPADYRSEANGVINTMGGIASIVGTIGLARLMDLDTKLPLLGNTKDRLPFPLAGLFVVLAIILLFAFIREKKPDQTETSEQKIPMIESFRNVAAQKDKSALYILISLFLWFLGYQGVLPFIGKYSVDVLKTSSGTAALAAGMVGIAYAIFALPSGYVAHRVGRKKLSGQASSSYRYSPPYSLSIHGSRQRCQVRSNWRASGQLCSCSAFSGFRSSRTLFLCSGRWLSGEQSASIPGFIILQARQLQFLLLF